MPHHPDLESNLESTPESTSTPSLDSALEPVLDSTLDSAAESTLAQNLARIQAQVESASRAYALAQNLPAHSVQIIAVSKYQSLESMRALAAAGQRAFGENRVQDLRAKAHALHHNDTPIKWHFIGTLQRNKINTLLALSPTLIHSIDSLELALTLDEKCKAMDRIQPVLLQVNSANEPSKHGFSLESSLDAFAHIYAHCPHLRLRGLMCIGAHTSDIGAVVESFARTKSLYDALCAHFAGVDTLSMGMSGDFAHAIAQGATMVRIGSALFAN